MFLASRCDRVFSGSVLITFLLQTPLLLQAADKVTLRYRFQPGQTVRYSVQMRDDYHVQLGETEERPYTSQASIKSFRVLNVNEQGHAQLELTLLEQVRVETFQNGELLKFDSTVQGGQVPTLFLPMQAMVGQPHLRLDASPTGAILNVSPLQGARTPESGNETALDVLLRLPEQPVEVGERWAEDFTVPVNVSAGLKKNVRMQRQYQLAGIEGDIARITLVTKSLTPLTVPEEQVQIILRTPSVDVQFDMRQGLLLSRTLTLENQVAGLDKGRGVVTVQQKHVDRLLPIQQAANRP